MKPLTIVGMILALAVPAPAQQIKLLGEDNVVALSSQSALPVIIPPLPEPGAAAAAPAKPAAPEPVPAPAAKAGTGGGFAVTKKHAVARGETLWGLAGKYYGDSFKWGKIYNANMDKIEDPDRIYPEEEINIPEITEVVKPELRPETAAEAEVPGGEEAGVPAAEKTAAASEEPPALLPLPAEKADAGSAAPPAGAAVPPGKASIPPDGEGKAPDFELADFSAEMPEDQKEWPTGAAVIVPENWKEDGVLVSRVEAGEEEEADGLTAPGDRVRVKVRDSSGFRPGEIISAYMKGAIAYDKRTNKKLGRELQKTGSLEVLSVEKNTVIARIINANTSVNSGQVIKK
ncbi:MAG: hypothetical protein A2X28_08135 [Elusimicrobia bacterium GWA2_56_46]|nr:MAG: hypothetical protein A2X28_08135 [Elusimicrobia bacterium GWA2_56_46]OGR54276.1 MAG: hypothetical protein A2X39_03575 [Elusimicrobia bacterium GWC2_56_31]HBB66991.1 hypothetical protein [Elusimicrobiota bacterium]HBW22439.1 hypothetical protein [Elusimicrobiota bacterium]